MRAHVRAQRFRAPADGTLDAAMLAAYRRDGFLVLENFIPAGECTALRARAAELAAADGRRAHSVFSAADQAHAEDAYFRESGDKIRFFYEPESDAALNKIGHALHDLDPVFDRFSRRLPLAAVAASLGVAAPLLLQSMYIFKGPHIGGEVGWHQDACFLYTRPISVVGFWFALEDATRENGCMQAIPGGHRGPLRQRFLEDSGRLVMRTLDPTPWPTDEPMLLEAPRGSLVVLHGLLPHGSATNRSPHSREAYTLHVIDGRTDYPADNWLHRDNLSLRGFA
jgi:phytanoyl-CoA hydroxylase